MGSWYGRRQKKEYGPHIFAPAPVNYADHVFWRGYGTVFFSVLGP